MSLEFAGAAIPLTDQDIEEAAESLGVEPAVIRAVDEVESPGGGFLPDGRPTILFEAHVFGRETSYRHNNSHPNISASSWNRSLYGAGGAHQYDRMGEAIKLDRVAALKSASYGRYQVMGFNFAKVGFPGIEAYVAKMMESERAHLDAFLAYCRKADCARYLVTHEWEAFTALYNGTGQVEYYAGRLEAAYKKWSAKVPPKVVTPSYDRKSCATDMQKALEKLGLYTAGVDGDWGPKSRKAYDAFNQ